MFALYSPVDIPVKDVETISSMTCPHCSISIHEAFAETNQFAENALAKANVSPQHQAMYWHSRHMRCPECGNSVIFLERHLHSGAVNVPEFMAYPPGRSRPVHPDVPDPYRQDFIEACLVLQRSPKASAALSRRCLQAILRDKAGTTKKELFDQIEEIAESGKIPGHIAEGLHAVRTIGNIAAHSMKSTVTGSILEVEPGESEWNLDIIESLFDFYFVQPALARKRKDDLNRKLKEAGKPVIA
jgi:hypothetical protein